jgi:acyl-coenzyme A thioesterase PaaI-like protein
VAPLNPAGADFHPDVRPVADPDHPGWYRWDMPQNGRFHESIGPLLIRSDGPGRGICRMLPQWGQGNLGGAMHGGAILTFIDMALFAGGRAAGANTAHAVTLDCAVQFISPGQIGIPLDAELDLLRETGRLAFFRGTLVQEEEIVAAFSGTLRKVSPRA